MPYRRCDDCHREELCPMFDREYQELDSMHEDVIADIKRNHWSKNQKGRFNQHEQNSDIKVWVDTRHKNHQVSMPPLLTLIQMNRVLVIILYIMLYYTLFHAFVGMIKSLHD